MGGRGGHGGAYDGYSVDYLNRIRDRYVAVVEQNKIHAMFNENSESKIIRQKARTAKKAREKAFDKIDELDKAIEKAKHRKTIIPF